MKEIAKQLAVYYGCTTEYSGKNRTMYVYGEECHAAVGAIRSKVTNAFKVMAG